MPNQWVPDGSQLGGHWEQRPSLEVPGGAANGTPIGGSSTGAGGGNVLPGGTVDGGSGKVLGGILLPPQPITPFDWHVLFPSLAGSPPPKTVNGQAATIGSAQAARPGSVVPMVYGTQRVEGQLIYQESHDAATGRFAYVVCCGPISAIRKVFINGHDVTSAAYFAFEYHLASGVYGSYTQAQDSWMAASQFPAVGPTVSRFPGVVVARITISAPLSGMSWSDAVPDGPNLNDVAFEVDGLVVTELRENRIPNANTFTAASGWASNYTPPTVTGSISDPFGGTNASQLAFGSAGPNDWYLDVGSNATTAGATVRVAVWMRTTSGTLTVVLKARKTGGTGTEEGAGRSIGTVGTTWTRWTRDITTTGDGTGLGIKLYIASGTPTLQVFIAQIDTLTTDRGSLATSGTAIVTGTERFTANWATCFYNFVTNAVHGCGVSTSYVDPDNFGNAAALCEQYGFQMNLVLSREATSASWIDSMRVLACAELYFEDGYYRVWIDTPQTTVAATFISGRTDGLPIGTWNARDVQYDAIPSNDQPTRVIIEFPNAAKNYQRDTTLVEVAGVSEGTTELREARYVLEGCTVESQAQRIATYIVNQAAAALRVTFVSSFLGITLARGSLIALSTSEGLAAQQFLVEDRERIPSGVYSIRCRQYASGSYNPSAVVGDTAIATNLVNPFSAVEVAGLGNALGYGGLYGYSPLVFWDRPHYFAPEELYTATWSSSGSWSTFDTSKINDGDTSTTAAESNNGISDLRALLDLGSGVSKNFGGIRVNATSTGTFKMNAQYSDDGISYSGPIPTAPYYLATTGASVHTIQWTAASHRYWKLTFERVSGTQTITLKEAQYLVSRGDNPCIRRYRVFRGDAAGATDELLAIVEGGNPPTQSNPLDLTSQEVAEVSGGSLYKTLNIIVQTETTGGVISSGVAMYVSGATDGTERPVFARAGTTAPATKQTNTSVYLEEVRGVTLKSDSTVTGTGLAGGLLSSANPIIDGSAAPGTSAIPSRQDHVHPTDTSRAPTASPTFTGTFTSGGIVRAGTLTSLTDNVSADLVTIALGSGEFIAGQLTCYISASKVSERQLAHRRIDFQAYEEGGVVYEQIAGTTNLGDLLSTGTLGVTFGTSTTATTFTLNVTADSSLSGPVMACYWRLDVLRGVTVT